MARVFVLSRSAFLKRTNIFNGSSKASFVTFSNASAKRKLLYASLGMAAAGGLSLVLALERAVQASSDVEAHPHALPWPHAGWLDSYDINSVRRGYFVYKNVCAACHTISLWKYRHFVDTMLTDKEARAEAAERQIVDGPGDDGKMFERPGKLNDGLPVPYANDVMAKLANNGAIPPDLAFITQSRHGGEDYVFHLLTGYQEPPAGKVLEEGQAYNPYFPGGGVLSMAQQLFDEMLEYPDGTPATQSQMAKDVTTFLKFLAEPDQDDRKRYAFKLIVLAVPVTLLVFYYKKFFWTSLKSQKWAFKQSKPPS
jgi:ubiquinol-cytochrome c reductase cytochrome c1 subunit